MDEQTDLSGEQELDHPSAELDGRGSRALRWTIVALSVAALGLAVAFGFWKISELSRADRQLSEVEQRQALEKSWSEAQSQAARGVDFELRIRAVVGSSLSFDHGGTVTASDGCFEAESDYIVLTDGSLAIRDLTATSSMDSAVDCGGAEPSPLFGSSRVSFDGNSWIASDPAGRELLVGLLEQR